MKKFLVIMMAGLIPAISFSALENDPLWMSLYYYKKTISGKYESLVDNKEFFFHPKGKYRPDKELEAALLAFQNTDKKFTAAKQYAQCAFPERFNFIKTHFKDIKFPKVECKDLETWKKALSPKSLSLVFSSAYANNPGSMFGHVLIKFNNHNPDIFHKDLLNYTASFGAIADPNDNPVFYAIKGMFGGYKSYFTLQPYYVKTSEYNNSESRDLWDYELDIKPFYINRILNHLWELYGSAVFDYYFFDENCSLYVSKLLELGLPHIKLSPHKFFTLPQDIITRFTEHKEIIKKVRFRSSIQKQIINRWRFLKSSEKDQFLFAYKNKSIDIIKDSEKLDLFAQYLEYKKQQDKDKFKEADLLDKTLLALSKSGKVENVKILNSDKANRPDWAHGPSKLKIMTALFEDRTKIALGYKGVLHDLYDPDDGYEPFNKIDLLNFDISYDTDLKEFSLYKLRILDVQSLPSFSSLFPKLSWSVGSGLSPHYELNKIDSLKADLYGGIGLTQKWGYSQRGIFFTFFNLRAEASNHQKDLIYIGPSINLGLIQTLGPIKMGLESSYYAPLFQGKMSDNFITDFQYKLSYNWDKNLQIIYNLGLYAKYGEFKFFRPLTKLNLNFYF